MIVHRKETGARRRMAGGAVGNFGEQFDYSAYALVAPTLAQQFFTAASPVAAMLGTFAVYALSFVARPFGGVLFGYVGDRYGRLSVLTWTVVLMGGGTMLIGLLPGYDSIGLAAPLLLVFCRLVQGLSIGGETTGVESFISESAPDDKRASWMTIVMSFAYWPTATAALVIFGTRAALGDEAFESWGWRLPFLFGGVVALVGYVLRRTLADPEEYTQAVAEQARAGADLTEASVARQLGDTMRARRSMLLVVLLQPPMAVGAYLLTGYMYTFVVSEGGLSSTEALLANCAAVVALAVLLPFTGRLCDRVGRKPLLVAGAGWLFVTAYPAFVLAGSGDLLAAVVGQTMLAIGVALYSSACWVTMIELFPTVLRCRGHGISYNLSVALFGGTTPLVAAALVGWSGSPVAPAFYAMGLIAAFGVAGILLVPETRGVSLRTSIYSSAADSVARTDPSTGR
jgi:MFS transporter, MHS family, proline/betaine transporter